MFNVKLYKDMFKQLRMSGLIFTVLSAVISCFAPISTKINIMALAKAGLNDRYGQIIRLVDITPVLIFAAFIVGFALPMIAFSFLNKRNASDYYHSLPNTRVCTFLSITAAIVTWIFIVVVSTVLVASATYFICGLKFNFIYIFYLITVYVSSTLLVAAVTTLAMSITGTVFTNIIVTGLIGFLPRFIMFASSLDIVERARVIDESSLGLLQHIYNLPVSFVILLLDKVLRITDTPFGYDELLGFKGGILYTFILAVIYLGLACFLFHKRKSEMADRSSPSKILQHVYRCSITLPVMILLSMMITMRGRISIAVGQLIALTFVSLAVYFLYELITTRSLRSMLTSAPYFLVVAAVAFGVSYGSYLTAESILNQTPSAEEIKYVQLKRDQPRNTRKGYVQNNVEQIEHNNVKLKQIVSDGIKETAQSARSQWSNVGREPFMVSVKLNNGKKINRIILVPTADYNTINQIEIENPAFLPRLRQLPGEDIICFLQTYDLSAQESKDIYKVFKQELNELSDSDYISAVAGRSELGTYYNSFQTIYAYSTVGVKQYEDTFGISALTPKTAQFFINAINSHISDLYDKSLDYILSYDFATATEKDSVSFSFERKQFDYGSSGESNEYVSKNCSLQGDGYTTSNRPDDLTIEQLKSIAAVLKEGLANDMDITKPILWVRISTRLNSEAKAERTQDRTSANREDQVYVTLTEQQMAEIYKICDVDNAGK